MGTLSLVLPFLKFSESGAPSHGRESLDVSVGGTAETETEGLDASLASTRRAPTLSSVASVFNMTPK